MKRSKILLFGYMEERIRKLERMGRNRTAENYRSALNCFRKYRKGTDIGLGEVTAEEMEGYEAWLRRQGRVPNTISFYCRILRSVYNHAVSEGKTEDRHPFRYVYTGIEKTRKRAVDLSTLRRLKKLDLTDDAGMQYARDMFMMSFYLRGMSLVDMAFLKKGDLCDGKLTYRRRKTQRKLTIAWTAEMEEIVRRYDKPANQYLLPILGNVNGEEERAYRKEGFRLNYRLKKLSRILGLDRHLTMYVARHSWATNARAKGIPISTISEGMGHSTETMTHIYLATIDTSRVDRANAILIESL